MTLLIDLNIRSHCRHAWALFFLFALGQSLYGQLPGYLSSGTPSLRVDVNLVTLNFRVQDIGMRNIRNLEKTDIQIYEDEINQDVAFLERDPSPISLVVLLDLSESMAPFSKQLELAARVVADILSDQDQTAVIAFSDLPEVLQDFTRDRKKVSASLQNLHRGFAGATNVNDAVYLAAKKLSLESKSQHRAILLLSDGRGNRGEAQRAFTHLKSCGATLLGVSLGLKSQLLRGGAMLNRWFRETGGDVLPCSGESQLRTNIADALDGVRTSYAAGYISSNLRKDGAFHHLKLEISPESPLALRHITIQGPSGYFAPQDYSLRP